MFVQQYHVCVVKQRYWGGNRRYQALFDLGRCDDRQRQPAIREIVQDYQPLVHAKVVISRGRVWSSAGKWFFKKMRGKTSSETITSTTSPATGSNHSSQWLNTAYALSNTDQLNHKSQRRLIK